VGLGSLRYRGSDYSVYPEGIESDFERRDMVKVGDQKLLNG